MWKAAVRKKQNVVHEQRARKCMFRDALCMYLRERPCFSVQAGWIHYFKSTFSLCKIHCVTEDLLIKPSYDFALSGLKTAGMRIYTFNRSEY